MSQIYRYLCRMKLTFLGTGTSQGVPVIGCGCEVCLSDDRRNRRLRTSAMVEVGEGDNLVRLIIDAGPDFRYQMLREGVRRVDAVLLTHEHKDHIGGLDDLRAFNFVDYPIIHRIPVYGTKRTIDCVRSDYSYAFAENRYRGVPEIELCEIDPSRPIYIKGVEIIPISGGHSDYFSVTGFRIGKMAYLTDFKTISDSEVDKLRDVDILVVNALRRRPHDSHFSLSEALELIRRVAPKRSLLTHMSHEMGLASQLERELPQGVEAAYDGLSIEI